MAEVETRTPSESTEIMSSFFYLIQEKSAITISHMESKVVLVLDLHTGKWSLEWCKCSGACLKLWLQS